MNSPFSTLFLAVQARLKVEVPEILFTEQDLGQLEEQIPSVTYPCALIDLTDWAYETAGENIQFATGAIHIRVCMEAWSQTSNITPAKWRAKALSFYDLEWKVYKALQDWQPPGYGAIIRESVSTEGREDNLRVRLMRFTCNFEDFKATPVYNMAPLPPPEFTAPTPPDPGGISSPFKVRIPHT